MSYRHRQVIINTETRNHRMNPNINNGIDKKRKTLTKFVMSRRLNWHKDLLQTPDSSMKSLSSALDQILR
jgi:hypothetical protein